MSLVYEVVWARLLATHLGSTTKGHTVVIATFMAGLGLGYLLFGRRSDRSKTPLRLYGQLELGVALSAFLMPYALSLTELWPWLSVFWVLLPTVLMGGTLPALTSALSDAEVPGPTIAWLYGVNALGAVAGVLVAGFWGVEQLGLTTTNHLAAGLNLLIGLSALYLARGRLRARPLDAQESASSPWVMSALVAAGAVGFVSLCLQGAWIRFFAVVFGSSSYALSLVLAAFILGIALGSLLIRRWASKLSPVAPLVALSLGVAAMLWLTGLGYERLPYVIASIREALLGSPDGFRDYSLARFGLAFFLLLGPTTLFGAMLPLAARLSAKEAPGAGTGRVFAINTMGAVLGAALSLPVLVPALGLDGVHSMGAWVMLAVGALLSAGLHGGSRNLALCTALILGLTLVALPTYWDPQVVGSGAFRMKRAGVESHAAFAERALRSDLLFHQDGTDATVSVLERAGQRVLMVNGKPDASTRGDMVTQVMSAHVPLLLHPEPEEVLVIGHGSGVTSGSALHHPEVSLDIIEVSQAVMDASRYFDAWSGAPLDNPRANVIVDDVRSALRARPEATWDVIISEPSNPWVAGNAGLFSVDFFRLLASRMSEGGLVAQWVQRYETDDETLLMVLRSFSEAFDAVRVFQLYPTDLLLIGCQGCASPDLGAMAERLSAPDIARDMERVGLRGLYGLASLEALTPKRTKDLLDAHPGPLNTVERPRLEFEAPRRLFEGARAMIVKESDIRRRSAASEPDALWRGAQANGPVPQEDLEALFIFHTTYPGAPESFRLSWIERLLSTSDSAFVIDLGFTMVTEGRWEAFSQIASRLSVLAPDTPKALFLRAYGLIMQAKTEPMTDEQRLEARALLTRCVALGDEPKGRCGSRLERLNAEVTR